VISVHVNGEELFMEPPLTLQSLIQSLQISPQAVAVAVNSEIVPRSEHSAFPLRDKDRIEIIRPAGGG
jgi:sulfur carrier protein